MRKRSHPRRHASATTQPSPPTASWHGEALAVSSLIAAVLAFWWPAASLRRFLAHGDICYFFEPMKAYLHESLRAGRLALWSPYVFCGYPVGAEGQIATFSPIALLISWLLPSPGAINWLVICHLLIAGISTYGLSRVLGLTPFPSWLSGFVMAFSGFLLARSHHVGLVGAAAWLPTTVLLVERAWHLPLPYGVLAAMAWAMSALAGHPQTTFHLSLVVIFWLGWRWARQRRPDRRRAGRRVVAVLALTFGLGAALAAVQLLLTRDLSAISYHGDRRTWEYVTSFSLRPEHLAGLFSPTWQGSPALGDYTGENYYWEYVCYLGLVPLALAVVGGCTRDGWALAGLAVAALAMAMGEINPLYHLLYQLPGFGDFRVPARYLLVFTFATVLLSGLGWQRVARLPWLRAGRRLAVAGALVAMLTAVDLMLAGRHLRPLSTSRVYAKPEAARFLERDRHWGRALILPPVRFSAGWLPDGGWSVNPDGWSVPREMLALDIPQSYGIRTIGGYPTLINREQTPFFERALNLALGRGDLSLVSLIGVRYLLVDPARLPRGATGEVLLPGSPVGSAGPYAVYRNEAAFPRVFSATTLHWCESRDQALARLTDLARSGRLAREAVAQGRGNPLRAGSRSVALQWSEPRPERVSVTVRADGEAVIVLNERWDPGWRAYCDGRPGRLLQVDGVLMGAVAPAGQHRMEFVYQPRGLIVGRVVSGGAAGLALILLVAPLLRRRRGR